MVAAGLAAVSVALPQGVATADGSDDVMIVTVNAHQRDYDDARMHELTRGIATRTPKLPDLILVDEILGGGITAMRDQLNATTDASYVVIGATNSVKVKMLVNTRTMTQSRTRTWADVCDPDRVYQVVTATDRESGTSLSVSGVHFAPSFNDGGSDDCKQSNAQEARRQMAEAGSSGVVGDFNKRYGADYYECNPNEDGDPLPWWSEMTAQSSVDGRSYTDTVRATHYGRDMPAQWSWQNAEQETLCTGETGYRRSRIDYIFASSEITTLDASADQEFGYSDHRFVWARLNVPDEQLS